MNLIELYSCTLSQKITKPYLNPIYYPIPFDKYIVIQAKTKESKNYDYFCEIIEFIKPELEKQNIHLVSVGGKPEENLLHCYPTAGQTSFNQLEYIIQNSIGYIGADSISSHIAGAYNKPLIVLISNNYAENVRPFWGDKSKQIIIEPEWNGKKPSFSFQENPKIINTIKPEKILEAINQLFKIESPQIKSIYFGNAYSTQTIDILPNMVLSPQSLSHIVPNLRLDWTSDPIDYNIILHNLSQRKFVIITNRTINLAVLKQVRPNVAAIIYQMPQDDDIEFIHAIKRAGFQLRVTKEFWKDDISDCDLKNKQNELKFKYLDIIPIQFIERTVPKISYQEKLNYRSNRIILSNNQQYSSEMAYKANLLSQNNTQKIENEEQFNQLLKENEYLYIYEKPKNN